VAFVLDDETTVSAQDAFNSTRDQRAQPPQTNFNPPAISYGDANQALNYGDNNAAPSGSGITFNASQYLDTSQVQDQRAGSSYWDGTGYVTPAANFADFTVDHGSPSQDAYGLNYGPQNNGDANNDGLNDQTGWANGVVQDASSPTGFSYYGTPTYSDGAQYFAPGAYGPQQPQEEAGYNLDFASPFGGTANDAPVAPYIGNRIYADTTPGASTIDIRPGDQQFNPDMSYPPGSAEDAMANHPNGGPSFLDTLKGIPGDVIDWGQRVNARAADTQGSNFVQDFGNAASGNHLINVLSGKDPNELPGPLPYVTDVAASPLAFQGFGGNALTSQAARASADMLPGILGTGARLGASIVAPAGEESALAVYGKNALAGFGGIGATKGADAGLTSYANSSLPGADIAGDPRVRTAVTVGAGLLGGAAGYYAPEAAGAAARAVPKVGESLAKGVGQFDAGLAGGRLGAVDEAGNPLGYQTILGGAEDTVGPLNAGRAVTDSPEMLDARRALLDALDKERAIRRSGTAAAEITAGRSAQAQGIGTNVRDALASGASAEEINAAARSGAKVGTLRKTFAEPLNITDSQKAILLGDATQKALDEGKNFDVLTIGKAFDKLVKGEGVQPAEAKALRKYFGDEVANAVVERPKPPRTVAEATAEDFAKSSAIDPQVRRLEAQANAQHRLADKLQADGFENNDPKLLEASKTARAKAIDAQNAADRKEIEIGQRAVNANAERVAKQQATEIQQANRAGARSQEAKDLAQARSTRDALLKDLRAAGADLTDTSNQQVRQLNAAQKDFDRKQAAWQRYQDMVDARERRSSASYNAQQEASQMRAAAQGEQTANRQASRLAEAADKRNPNDQMLVDKAKALLGEQPNTSSALNRASVAAVENWVDANRVLLDSIGETRHQALAIAKATVTGDVPDSYVSHLIERKGMLETALNNTGMDPVVAGKVADTLTQAELKMRYKGEPPQWVQDSLDKTKSGAYGDPGSSIARGASAASQEFKNTAFGLMDVGVFGQQVLHAIGTSGVQGLAGLVNRALAAAHLPHLDTTIAEGVLSKRIQYGLDGVAQGVHTGIVDIKPGQGTLLRVIPGLGNLDPYLAKFIAKSTDFQFGTVLGNLRNTIYEGNLVMAHLAGQDITNPAVRAQAAEFANAATSAGRRATNSTRALTESAALLSPSMTRAQIQQVMKVARLLAPGASTTERVLAATTIASTAASLLAVGKFLNDAVGIDDFEFDPSKANFGVITLPGGTHVDLFPQEQFVKALATSMRVLAEGNPEDAATAWGKFALSRSSPILGTAEKATGFGYEPGRGYRFGDYGKGMDLKDRLINIAPVPPILQSAYQGDLNAVSGPLQFFGLNTFEDSNYQARNRWLQTQDFKDAQGNQITDYSKLDRLQKQQADAAFGKVQSTNPDVLKQQADTEALRQTNIKAQSEIDAQGPGQQWRDDYHKLQERIRGQIQDNQIRNPYTGKESGAPLDAAVKEWGNVIDANTKGVTVNWDAVDKWMADNPDKAALVNEYMSGKKNTDLTPMVTQYKTDSKTLADSGYFDYKDEIWKEIAKDDAELSKFPTYYDWKASIEQQIRSEVEPGTPTVIVDGIVDKVVGKIPVTKIYSKVSNTAETNWIAQHPKLAGIAYKWGYLSPTKTERSIIASGDGQ